MLWPSITGNWEASGGHSLSDLRLDDVLAMAGFVVMMLTRLMMLRCVQALLMFGEEMARRYLGKWGGDLQ